MHWVHSSEHVELDSLVGSHPWPTWTCNALTVQVKITQNLRSSFWEVEARTGRSATSNLNPVLLPKLGPIVPKGRRGTQCHRVEGFRSPSGLGLSFVHAIEAHPAPLAYFAWEEGEYIVPSFWGVQSRDNPFSRNASIQSALLKK